MFLLDRVNTLRKKIAIALFGVIFFTGSLFVYFASRTGYEMLERQAFARAESVASVIKSIFDHLMVEGKHDKLPNVLRNAIRTQEIKDVLILKKDGTVSMHAQKQKEFEIFPMERLKTMPNQQFGKYFSQKDGNDLFLYISEPLNSKKECYTCHNDPQTVEGFIVVKVKMNDLKMAAERHRTTNIIIATFTFLGIGFVLFAALSFLVIKPIRNLRSYIQQLLFEIPKLETGAIVQLPLSEHISRTHDEIVDLDIGFNKVVQSLNEAYKKIFTLHKIQLGYADRLASTGEIAASVAHEIKNPIAGIVGALQIIKKDYPESNPKHEIIDEMLSQLARMNQSINDLLAYAKPKPPELSFVKLQDVLDRTLSLLSHTIENQSITLETKFDIADTKILADGKQLQQVLWNVLLNAIQAIDKNGTIWISAFQHNDRIEIHIKDSGSGISDEHLANIFKPFYTTKHKGTGLGLSICKQIVEDHHGTIAIDTTVGAGTTVKITLPLQK